jgi:hypothetical protein
MMIRSFFASSVASPSNHSVLSAIGRRIRGRCSPRGINVPGRAVWPPGRDHAYRVRRIGMPARPSHESVEPARRTCSYYAGPVQPELANLEHRLKEVAKPRPRNREPLVVFISPVAQQKDKKGRLVATLSRGDCVYFRYSADPGIAR